MCVPKYIDVRMCVKSHEIFQEIDSRVYVCVRGFCVIMRVIACPYTVYVCMCMFMHM